MTIPGRKALVLGVLCFASLSANAGPAVIVGDEVRSMLVGKAIVFVRDRDNAKMRWDIKDNGYLYANNYTTGQSDQAKWEIHDDQLCVTWFGRSNSGCSGIMKEGEKIRLYNGSKDAPKGFATLIE